MGVVGVPVTYLGGQRMLVDVEGEPLALHRLEEALADPVLVCSISFMSCPSTFTVNIHIKMH